MVRLKNRQIIPDGITFRQPETGFTTRAHSTFRGMVDAVVMHRRANPELARIHKWTLDPNGVADEIDSYLAIACQSMGPNWGHFITEGSADPPRLQPPPQSSQLRRVAVASVVGVETIIEWIKSGEEAVPQELADKRAATCLICPKHGKGGWLSMFTKPVQDAISKAIQQRKEWNLSTQHDDKLEVCEVCDCPMKLKIFMPLNTIVSKMKPEVFQKLPPDICWIRKER